MTTCRTLQRTLGEAASDDDDLPPEVTQELNRLTALGSPTKFRALMRALFAIPRSALRRGTGTTRGKFVEDMKKGIVNSKFVAAEVARDLRYDAHAGTLASKALRIIVRLAAMRDRKDVFFSETCFKLFSGRVFSFMRFLLIINDACFGFFLYACVCFFVTRVFI